MCIRDSPYIHPINWSAYPLVGYYIPILFNMCVNQDEYSELTTCDEKWLLTWRDQKRGYYRNLRHRKPWNGRKLKQRANMIHGSVYPQSNYSITTANKRPTSGSRGRTTSITSLYDVEWKMHRLQPWITLYNKLLLQEYYRQGCHNTKTVEI